MFIPPDTPGHQCAPPKRPRVVHAKMPVAWTADRKPHTITTRVAALPGSLWRCATCKTWWVAYQSPPHRGGGYSPREISWRTVGFWDFKLRKRIKKAEQTEAAAVVASWPNEPGPSGSWIPFSVEVPIISNVVEGPPPQPPRGPGR